MRSPAARGVFLAFTLALVCVLSLSGPAVGMVPASAAASADVAPALHPHGELLQTEPEGDGTVAGTNQTIEIHVMDDGSAQFVIGIEFEFTDDVDRETFERTAADFETGEVDATYTMGVFEEIVRIVDDETDRNHEIRDVERGWSATNESGELTLTFVWDGFARTTNSELFVDDAFVVAESTWLPGLSENQRLEIHAPQGYAVDRAPAPVGAGGMVSWEGPVDFEPNEIELTYVPRGEIGPPDDEEPPPNGNGVSMLSVVTIALALALVVALALLVYLARQRDEFAISIPGTDRPGPIDEPRDGEDAVSADEPAPDELAAEEPEAPTPEDPYGGVDPELLSDEERVIRLLKANDGRMKQATIVKETRWSNAKVSQLLSAMAEKQTIEKLRIGRENLITLLEENDRSGEGGD